MTSSRASTGAVLAGSLAAFPLLDVLELLSRTQHAGALQVVGDGVDEHLWVDAGDLLEKGDTATERLFTLAVLNEAWFTVTPGIPPQPVPEGDRIALAPLIELVAPQVQEWQSLVSSLPSDHLIKMASSTPGPEVQIRAEQWHILSVVGTGRPVHEVVAASGASALDTMRIIGQLRDEHLISLEEPVAEPAPELAPVAASAPAPVPAPAPVAAAAPAPPLPLDTTPPWREAPEPPADPEAQPAPAVSSPGGPPAAGPTANPTGANGTNGTAANNGAPQSGGGRVASDPPGPNGAAANGSAVDRPRPQGPSPDRLTGPLEAVATPGPAAYMPPPVAPLAWQEASVSVSVPAPPSSPPPAPRASDQSI